MLDQDTKRKIDSARDILVGKVPDPKAQVEQITTALIYKFMDDMDKESQELGGKVRFFTNGYEKYAWTKLMDSKLGGQDRLNLYIEAITSLSQNPHIPQLFRDIFKDTFLPYRNPETLNLFLKEVNGFSYENSEDLGDAFEYLLSVLGSQGDAGQFRTPRHIIDFIVAAVDPKKVETICDPACGTAGFLISAYKHILKQHDGLDDPENKEKPLTPDERKSLMDHFAGYDISPDMVRLSKVNLYLHGFPRPTIFEYDTLSSEEKWDESFDVMLANPPFMSPKGGIKPHKRFSVQANRSEVLFVDYILEHLRPRGRAGIIVPEGIIFKSEVAYKNLRKMLVEDGLMAVISLPAGVFNPYAGVKTSILLFDNEVAKITENILFIKIENDGYELGAQRREHDKNDLPLALAIIKKYKSVLKDGEDFEFIESENLIAHLVTKEKIAKTGEYNLLGDRYKEVLKFTNPKWPLVELGEVCEIFNGARPKGGAVNEGILSIGGEHINSDGSFNLSNPRYIPEEFFKALKRGKLYIGDVLVVKDGATTGKVGYFSQQAPFKTGAVNEHVFILRPDTKKVAPFYLYSFLKSKRGNAEILKHKVGAAQGGINLSIRTIKIPLPTIEAQKEIVEQIEVKQSAVEHAKAIIRNLENERRYFGQSLRGLENVKWVELGSVCDVRDGTHESPKFVNKGYPLVTSKNVKNGTINFDDVDLISKEDYDKIIKRSGVDDGDIIMPMIGTIGNPIVVKKDRDFAIKNVALIKFKNNIKTINLYIKYTLISDLFEDYIRMISRGGTQKFISLGNIRDFKIPLPTIEIQKQLVARVEKEQEIINANKQLIEICEQKIADVISDI